MSMLRALATTAFAATALVAGCVTGRSFFPPDSAARPADAAPRQFNDAHMMVLTSQMMPMGNVPASAPGSATGSKSVAPPACRALLVSPEDGTRLQLVRSDRGQRGDYAVGNGHYGVKANELLRVDCRTNRTIGIVPAR